MSSWGRSEKSSACIGPVQLSASFDEHFLIVLLAIFSETILLGSVLIILFWLMSLNLVFDH